VNGSVPAVAPGLAELQRDFLAHLRHGDGRIASAILDAGPIPRDERLAIYAHAFRARLVDALRDTCAKTHAWLGDDAFDAAALDHVDRHPSRNASLRDLGSAFADDLDSRWPDAPECGELARIDRALRHAFDGPDAPALGVDALARVDPRAWAEASITFVPTTVAIAIRTNAVAIWRALDAGADPPEAMRLDEPCWLLVWRKAWQPQYRSIGTDEHALFARLAAGASFAAALEALDGDDDAIAATAAACLRTWLDEGLVAAIVT
jgi:Putative DNA-binding domain